jgi:hypothetical protein
VDNNLKVYVDGVLKKTYASSALDDATFPHDVSLSACFMAEMAGTGTSCSIDWWRCAQLRG